MNKQASTIIMIVKSNKRADEMVARGIKLGGKKLRIERYINSVLDTICGNCMRWGHAKHRCMPGTKTRYTMCAEDYKEKDHTCRQPECKVGKGVHCRNTLEIQNNPNQITRWKLCGKEEYVKHLIRTTKGLKIKNCTPDREKNSRSDHDPIAFRVGEKNKREQVKLTWN